MPEVSKQSYFLRGDREYKQRFEYVRARSQQAPAAYLAIGEKEVGFGIGWKDLNFKVDFNKERWGRGWKDP